MSDGDNEALFLENGKNGLRPGKVSVKFDVPFGFQEHCAKQSSKMDFFGRVVPVSAALSIGFSHYSWVDTIRLFASEKVVVDADIKARGKMLEVIIVAPQIEVIDKRVVDLSGVDGRKNENPKAGSGANGLPGESGGNGGHFQLYCDIIQNPNGLRVNCKGGNGSNGQTGGDGEDGEDGRDGTPADYSAETIVRSGNLGIHTWQGFPGTKGQNGGDGGCGGLGGRGGRVIVVAEQESDGKIDSIQEDGLSGKDGEGGKAGVGGNHGADYEKHEYDEEDWTVWRYLDPLLHDGRKPKDLKAEDGCPGETGKCGRIAIHNKLSVFRKCASVTSIVTDYRKFVTVTEPNRSFDHPAMQFVKKLELRMDQMGSESSLHP